MPKNNVIFIFSGAGDAKSYWWDTEWHIDIREDKLEKSYRNIKYFNVLLLVQICFDLCVLQYNLIIHNSQLYILFYKLSRNDEFH